MCGITGEILFNRQKPNFEYLQNAIQSMKSRGPDAHGIYSQNSLSFGHTRLKIMDTSDHSSQPFISPDLGLVLVFNGAIYNYPELKRELQQKGYSFTGIGDTEVVLKAYHAWKEKCVEKFNGMFSFAIWERDSGEVFIARDRFGIKPFYYAHDHTSFRFASSLPALLQWRDISTELDAVAVHNYLSFHAVVPPPRTIFKHIKKLPQACYGRIKADGSLVIKTYWQAVFRNKLSLNAEEWKDRVLQTLTLSVQRRMLADVPVGVLLSGGVDSSMVVGLLAQQGQKNLHTFSIGFESVGGEKGDEFEYSDIIANHYQTDHHKIFIPPERALSSLDACITAMSEPMVSHDAIGFYLLSEEVARHIRVVQSGQGADEIFAGYHWYPPMQNSENVLQTYQQSFFDRSHKEIQEAVYLQMAKDYSKDFVDEFFQQLDYKDKPDYALHIDSSIMLVDDPVKRVDNMTMAWGLEARVPFLDHELVELTAQIPSEFKLPDGGKYILKEAARRVIPKEVIDRPKGYFPVPALKYIRGDFLKRVQQTLYAPEAKQRKLFKPDYIEHLLKDPDKHITPLRGSKLWQIALLERWLQIHIP